MSNIKWLKIRPYARLLTMLGDQLIKNERIALMELIKNAFDADAEWVKVSFIGFEEDYSYNSESKIIIEDNGHGMSAEIIEQHWMNPATPEKKRRKQIKETTPKGRFIQGEKGIGRFAILKLGRKIEIISRPEGANVENVIRYDFSKYDEEFLTEDGEDKDLFIEDLEVGFLSREPIVIKEHSIFLGLRKVKRQPKGTRIEITDLRGSWSGKKVEELYRDLNRLEPFFKDKACSTSKHGDEGAVEGTFNIWIYKDDDIQKFREQYFEKLNILLEERAVININEGIYDETKGEFRFFLNGMAKVLKLQDPEIAGLKVFKDHFGKGEVETECGSFHFGFYVFDRSSEAPAKYQLDKEDKEIIRDHRVYLYRDGIRVYPYGEPNDDWLRIDMYRGTISAGHFLSNDQVVGYVNISHKGNPRLKDKTNREGLIEEGNATDDFLALLRVFLAYIRQKPYARYRADLEKKSSQDIFRTDQVQKEFAELKKVAKDNNKIHDLVSKAEREYRAERKYLVQRAETTEELAGVGLSVETASHDIMSIMGKAKGALDNLIKETLYTTKLDIGELQKELQSLLGMISFIEAQLKDIQLLFKSSKQRRRPIKVKEIIEKVERIYHGLLKQEHIELNIHDSGQPLVAKTTDAVLLQLFLNLFDNAVYWLQQVSSKDKKIEIILDGSKGQMTFSDNGPGISREDEPYVFEPFYSGKGQEGRGLGLYIARQLLERNDYAIELAELKADRVLSGANFVVSFVEEEK